MAPMPRNKMVGGPRSGSTARRATGAPSERGAGKALPDRRREEASQKTCPKMNREGDCTSRSATASHEKNVFED